VRWVDGGKGAVVVCGFVQTLTPAPPVISSCSGSRLVLTFFVSSVLIGRALSSSLVRLCLEAKQRYCEKSRNSGGR
jgi:hypothetical protein